MNFKDLTKIRGMEAIGKVRLDLTDPLTGKVKERVEGKNHIFMDMLACQEYYSYTSVYPLLDTSPNAPTPYHGFNNAFMCMNDDGAALDTKFGLLRGQTVCYGEPNIGSNGIYRGAYNAANQVIGDLSVIGKARWKFQYDFTTAQGNGIAIKNVGLTSQYSGSRYVSKHGIFKNLNFAVGENNKTNDPQYNYSITTAGILTIYNKYNKSQTTVDLSAVVGNVSSDIKNVGYAPRTGKYYIWRGSSTASNRRMFVFSDNTFTTLETSYLCDKITMNSTAYPLYIYDNFMYYSYSTNTLWKANFVDNLSNYVTITIPTVSGNAFQNSQYPTSITQTNPTQYTIADSVGIYYCGDQNGGTNRGIVWSPDTDSIIAYFYSGVNGVISTPMFHPYVSSFNMLSGYSANSSYSYGLFNMGHAFTTYILPTPITKTSANGMTCTYELEALW